MFTLSGNAWWIIAIVLALGLEAFTLNLCAIWFAVGGVGGLIAATFDAAPTTQWIVFLVISAVFLVLARPMAKKMIGTKQTATNADRILGEQAIVTQTISNASAQGEIKIMGQYWTARSADGSEIPEGTLVRVREIVGVKAIVESLQSAEGKEG